MPNLDLAHAAAPLTGVLSDLHLGRYAESSWQDLRPAILGLIDALDAKRILEIGGGRYPFLAPEELAARGCELTVNDILEDELARAPASFHKSCFDIASPLPEDVALGAYDLIFSRMVFEHVRDGRQAWSNCLRLLAPGGVAFAFVPTLWSPPFVANRIIPERISTQLLRKIDADRTQEKTPKFPAFYDLCRADEKVVGPVLRAIGFREVAVAPFFGTPYFPVVPIVKHVARAFDKLVDTFNVKAFASYAYIVARK